MAFDVMQSLFGLTPTAVQQTLKAESEKRVSDTLNLLGGNPFAVGAAAPLRAGERMLTGTAQIAGQVDPRMQAAQQLQGIVQSVQQRGVDMSTPEGLIELANELNKVPDFAGFAIGMRQQAAQMQAKARRATLEEGKIISETEENIAQAEKARREPPPKPEKISREDRWVQLDAKKNSPEGLTTPEKNEYTALSRLLFKPEKGSDETATATRWNLETVAAQQSLTAMGVDWTKPLTGRNAALPGIVEVYQKANRGPWPGTGAAARPATATPTPAPARQMSAQDQEALRWANANPNDPRSKEIKRRLGVQ